MSISEAKNPLSLQIKVDDFVPATTEEKESLIIMRESVSFWKDGIRRFKKNKIAMAALSIVLFIVFLCFIVPTFCNMYTCKMNFLIFDRSEMMTEEKKQSWKTEI